MSSLGYNSPFEAALKHDCYTSKIGHQKRNAAFLWIQPIYSQPPDDWRMAGQCVLVTQRRALKYVVGGD